MMVSTNIKGVATGLLNAGQINQAQFAIFNSVLGQIIMCQEQDMQKRELT